MFILAVAALLASGGLVYFVAGKIPKASADTTGLVSTNTGQATGLVPATTGGNTQDTGDQVVSLLRNLSVIQLSDAVFQNPGFAMLQDISITLPPVTDQGRRNPFAPVGTDLVSFASATSATTTTSATGTATGK